MSSVICTLFEGHYHYGVAALINSLYKNGFRGHIFAGYRNSLPKWASRSIEATEFKWKGARTFHVAEEIQLHFLPLDTDYHLTNYKPDFMLQLWDGPAKDAEAMFYFDPDIVVTHNWSQFLKWISCGIAVCEDVNSPISEFHPRRVGWRSFYKKRGIELKYKNSVYVNGGFIGLYRRNQSFIEVWKTLQEGMAEDIGGLGFSAFPGQTISEEAQSPFSPFGRTDQDALNASIEAWDGPVSFLGQEAMAFKSGSAFLPHALGQPKPWHWNYIQQALLGRPPRVVDREFWNSTNGPVTIYSKEKIALRKTSLKMAALIGRFYHRNSI